MEYATLFPGPSSFGPKPEQVGVKIKEIRQSKGAKIFRKCRIDAAEEQLDLLIPGSEDSQVRWEEVREQEVRSHYFVLRPPRL